MFFDSMKSFISICVYIKGLKGHAEIKNEIKHKKENVDIFIQIINLKLCLFTKI